MTLELIVMPWHKGTLEVARRGFKSVETASDLDASTPAALPMVMSMSEVARRRLPFTVTVLVCVVTALGMCNQAFAQICRPVGQRTGEVGCWIMIDAPLGQLPRAPIFWHLDSYPTRAEAEAAKGPRGTIVESLGSVWLFTIGVAGWRPPTGKRVAEIGPLPVRTGLEYSAQYMEAIFTPGMTAPAHRHSGSEAWYTLAGETCLETPDGTMVGRAGGSHVIVPGGPPMHLTATGTETRRALVLILHDSLQPATTPADDWTPRGLCKNQNK
jgi:quercetin dioxygenase-like cupin family protein